MSDVFREHMTNHHQQVIANAREPNKNEQITQKSARFNFILHSVWPINNILVAVANWPNTNNHT